MTCIFRDSMVNYPVTSEKPTPLAWRQWAGFSDGMQDLRPLCVFADNEIIHGYSAIVKSPKCFYKRLAGFPLCQIHDGRLFSMGDNNTTSRKRTYTPEQRAAQAAYLRRYRAAHPDAVRRWRDTYTLRRAARLQAQAESEGGVEHGD